MRILCIVRRVPDSRATISVRAAGDGIDTNGLRFVCDPFDEFGVAQAVQLKTARSDVQEIIALAAGSTEADEPLRHALAMGADRAVRIDGEAPVHDEPRLAELFAAAVRSMDAGIDLVFCGKQSIDNDAGEFGPALGEAMQWPHVGAATKFELSADGTTARVHRRIEGAEEILDVRLPALITCEKGLIEPKQPALPQMMKAKKLPIELMELSSPASSTAGRGVSNEPVLSPPAGRPPCRYLDGDPPDMARELVRLLRDEAKVI